MTRDEYERRKQRIEEQLRTGIELMESAYRAQMRALDLVWMVQAEEDAEIPPAPPQQEPPPPPDLPRRRSAPEVDADVREVFPRLPATFTRRDVCAALGYEPDRGALYRALQDLTRSGALHVEELENLLRRLRDLVMERPQQLPLPVEQPMPSVPLREMFTSHGFQSLRISRM